MDLGPAFFELLIIKGAAPRAGGPKRGGGGSRLALIVRIVWQQLPPRGVVRGPTDHAPRKVTWRHLDVITCLPLAFRLGCGYTFMYRVAVVAALLTKENKMSNVTTLRRASTTFQNAIAQPTAADDIRDQLKILDELKRELGKRQEALREAAMTLGLARHDVSQRETAPSKAAYIKLHGLEAWEANKSIGSVRRFTWI